MPISDYCCICGKKVQSYNNPEPVRDGSLDCCDHCNRLVVKVRMKCHELSDSEREAFTLKLHDMSYQELADMFGMQCISKEG